jgi:hypothetical protein
MRFSVVYVPRGTLLLASQVLAGLPLGAQGATPGAYGLYVAIMAHKSLAAFALGSNFVTAGSSFSKGAIRCYLFCFAMMTPAGIGACNARQGRAGQGRARQGKASCCCQGITGPIAGDG